MEEYVFKFFKACPSKGKKKCFKRLEVVDFSEERTGIGPMRWGEGPSALETKA